MATTFAELKNYKPPKEVTIHCTSLEVCKKCEGFEFFCEKGFKCRCGYSRERYWFTGERYENKEADARCPYLFEHLIMGKKRKGYE